MVSSRDNSPSKQQANSPYRDKLVERTISKRTEHHNSDDNYNIAKVIELLGEANSFLSAIKGNTQDTEKDVWHPAPPKSETAETIIYVRVRVVNVGNIDTINQQFYCELYLYVKWCEPRLKGKEKDQYIPWDEYWDPRIAFQNIASCDLLERRHFFETKPDEAPFVCLQYHVKGYFKEVLEVNDFPFDYQDLTISIIARWRILKDRKIRFAQDYLKPDGLRTLNFLSKQEWDLQPHLLRRFRVTEKDPGMPDDIYPLYEVQMHVRRRASHYIYNVASVMFLIATLAFSSFIFSSTDPGNRLQITLTLLLTSVAFKYVISQSLPTVSYLTLMDKYVLCCIFFQFFMSMQASISGMIKDKSSRGKFEWVCFYLALIFFVIYHGICIGFALIKRSQVQKLIKKQNKEFDPVLKPETNTQEVNHSCIFIERSK